MTQSFASNVFDLEKMKQTLPPQIFKKFMRTVDQKKSLDSEVADFLARAIKQWAKQMGVSHFTHWFMPLTGLTAGKQNTFLEWEGNRRIISRFSGRDLIKGEPDASSFPHGGMRSTFEARGYTAWDPCSPVFVVKNRKNCVLFIPSVFYGYNGCVLDKKTPLLRSLRLINDISLKILAKFNQRAGWVKNMIGAEQEFFLVHEKDFQKRPDLKTVGRLIFGARPPRGQQMGDHYMGAIPEAVLHFLEDVEQEAFNLGIPVKTRHNEVAPNQFEIAPLYEEANIAADHNQLLMDLLIRIARNHGMVCLLHEKPFAFFNGSGKHINWSLMDSQGRNLFTPGDNKNSRLVFLSFLAGFIYGLNRYHDLLQAVLASPGNELRLGGHEAPPAIISVFLGDELQGVIDDPRAFISGKFRKSKMVRFEEFVPPILHDLSDRNRTSPVAFTGNKFEFRMPGSSASLAFPISVINLLVAAGLTEVYKIIEKTQDEKMLIHKLQHIISENSGIIYAGDNYNANWHKEARRRGLFIPLSVPETVDRLREEKNIKLFETFAILSPEEIKARTDIKIEIYVKTVEMELRVARNLLRAYIIPAALKNQAMLLEAIRQFPREILAKKPAMLKNQLAFIAKFTEKINRAMEMVSLLDEDNDKLKEGDDRTRAQFCTKFIRPHLAEAAALVEKIEERVDSDFWKLPRMTDILFR
ncbi:MAG: glutamine synthetase III [Acidobacteria bacterium]|nr:glutamine synthetase III [Acidobacteriota bacterium]MBU4306418.1 glutamine synthetase III [Acidobacteriota bacterium]MBU4404595.1 glutamine synthetase III [Acidobacteriota bacterium]MCG2812824.1 glutamine synthetase III [Candidatus Aminicenantes bacterium]